MQLHLLLSWFYSLILMYCHLCSKLAPQTVFQIAFEHFYIKNIKKQNIVWAQFEPFDLFSISVIMTSVSDVCVCVCVFTRSLSDLPPWRDTFGHLQQAFPLHIRMIALRRWRRVCALKWKGGFVLPLKNSTEGLLRLKGGLCISIIHSVPCILFSTPKKHALTSKAK